MTMFCDPDALSLVSPNGVPVEETTEQELPQGDLVAGTRLGAYVVESRIGVGGCGVVYVGRNEASGRQVAIKVLHSHLKFATKAVARFLREIELIEMLHHPHIVSIEDAGTLSDGRPYFVMEYLGPTTLASLCSGEATLSVANCVQILMPVCEALTAAHEAGIVHRDIKASNISVRQDGALYVVKLLDFGVAKLGRHEADGTGFTSHGRVIGTLHVMAPEQIRGEEVDARADIYALGVLLYRMLTGKVLFSSKLATDLIWRHLEEPAPRPSLLCNVPPAVDAAVLRCLEKDPGRRFQSAAAFIEALRIASEACTPDAGQIRGETKTAAGIYVKLHAKQEFDELDEEIYGDTQRALDYAEAVLSSAGFFIAMATGDALLGILTLPAELELRQAEERRAKTTADVLRKDLNKQMNEHARVECVVSFRVDLVLVDAPNGERFLGGPLLQSEDWATSPTTQITARAAV